MKVKVLTVDDVEIKNWHWWSDWIDIAVFNYASNGYLLQMKVSRNNSKKFKTTSFKSRFGFAHASIGEIGNLADINKGI